MPEVLETKLPLKLFRKGKVRDVYEIENMLLIIATDRISAFDVILPNPIPGKGKVLNMISKFWFDFTKNIIPNHMITTESTEIISKIKELKDCKDIIEGRSMLVKKTQPMPVECVVRGYLAGSGWKEYIEKGSVCGIKLPAGLRQSQNLPFPIFTPSTKATTGHDLNITEENMKEIVGDYMGEALKKASIEIYAKASEYARTRQIIIADTKFEFGMDGKVLTVIDEVLTPDSSRFWDEKDYVPGQDQKSFDKQPVRDYLETLGWNKKPPAPKLPEDAVRKTTERYLEAYRRITGKDLKI